MRNSTTYKIDRTVPVPGQARVSRTKRIYNTLGKLRVGESFVIPKSDWQKASKPQYLVPYKEARDQFIKIKSRIEPKGVRIWRVK